MDEYYEDNNFRKLDAEREYKLNKIAREMKKFNRELERKIDAEVKKLLERGKECI